jgi:hypothetical protein
MEVFDHDKKWLPGCMMEEELNQHRQKLTPLMFRGDQRLQCRVIWARRQVGQQRIEIASVRTKV